MGTEPRLDRLDHLRAIAAFMVLAWHITAGWPYDISPHFRILSIFKEGWTGVSLFCVISGFILTNIYGPREVKFGSFYKNRFLRIAPLFIFVVALGFYATENNGSLAMSLTGQAPLGGYAAPAWTVLVEFQFYLLFPFLLIFARRYGTKYLLGLLLAFVLAKAAVWISRGNIQGFAYYSIFGRMDQFLIGMIAALALSSARVKAILGERAIAIALFTIGLASAMLFFWWYHKQGGFYKYTGTPGKTSLWIYLPAAEGITYAFIVIGYLHLPKLPYTMLASNTLAYIGRVSYSIYLLHNLLIATILYAISSLHLVPQSWELALLLTAFIGLPIVVAASSLSYFLIEMPFMQLRPSAAVLKPTPEVVTFENRRPARL